MLRLPPAARRRLLSPCGDRRLADARGRRGDAAIAICSLPPFVIEQVKKPSWNTAGPDNVLLDIDDAPPGLLVPATVGA